MTDPRRDVAGREKLAEWLQRYGEASQYLGTRNVVIPQELVLEAAALLREPSEGQEPQEESVLVRLAGTRWRMSEGREPVPPMHHPSRKRGYCSECGAGFRPDFKPVCPSCRYLSPRTPSDSPAGSVKMPETEDEAALMAIMGEWWLRDNAPHRLRASDSPAGEDEPDA